MILFRKEPLNRLCIKNIQQVFSRSANIASVSAFSCFVTLLLPSQSWRWKFRLFQSLLLCDCVQSFSPNPASTLHFCVPSLVLAQISYNVAPAQTRLNGVSFSECSSSSLNFYSFIFKQSRDSVLHLCRLWCD